MSNISASQRLQGKVCIVTGSSSGLGRAISLGYAREGATLVCVDLQPKARLAVGTEQEINTDELIRQNNGRAIFLKADMSKAEDVEVMVHKAVAEYGRIDVYVPSRWERETLATTY
jgi:NAD(P)-dependent dehydrogenase (short-subunit alcohol dehydrogenase family)